MDLIENCNIILKNLFAILNTGPLPIARTKFKLLLKISMIFAIVFLYYLPVFSCESRGKLTLACPPLSVVAAVCPPQAPPNDSKPASASPAPPPPLNGKGIRVS
jgi:energy-converting hydrogenase Eha subunit C